MNMTINQNLTSQPRIDVAIANANTQQQQQQQSSSGIRMTAGCMIHTKFYGKHRKTRHHQSFKMLHQGCTQMVMHQTHHLDILLFLIFFAAMATVGRQKKRGRVTSGIAPCAVPATKQKCTDESRKKRGTGGVAVNTPPKGLSFRQICKACGRKRSEHLVDDNMQNVFGDKKCH
mmetsp:Transcript_29213/g.41101  ORF Transcript_29213/g.41101 Transcript_29213/m.41101 type:complete len:174 (+) Transcript_29213:587-1108(+)